MIVEALRSFVLADAAIAALVADRVYPLTLPQGVTLPAMTYQVVFGEHPVIHDGPQGLARARVQFDCWAERYSETVAIAGALRTVLNGYRGAMGAIPDVVAKVAGELDGWEPDVRAFRKTVDFQIWYVEG